MYLLLVDGHEQEVLLEDVHVPCPCLHPLMPPLPLTAALAHVYEIREDVWLSGPE